MPAPAFVHLHCHTDHSLLDGVGRSSEYAELAVRHGQTALAITDHGHLYGLPEHRRACQERGIKPLYGCELYVNDTRDESKEIYAKNRQEDLKKDAVDPTFTDNHLVVLCETDAGWKNLLRLNHDAVLNGYYYKPRTTHELVCRHAEGLIATTACMGSQFGQLAIRKDWKRLRALLGQFKDAFGDRFYYELHISEVEGQKEINAALMHEAGRLGIAPLLTCDVHYACGEDVSRQDEMIAIARHTALADPKAFKLNARSLWFCTPKDMLMAAKKWGYQVPADTFAAAVANTAVVAARCGADIYGDGSLKPPRYIGEDGKPVADPFEFLKQKAVEGFRARFQKRGPQYAERLKHELLIIRRCGMSDFYLVTMDVVAECRRRGVMAWVRGSGCASLVAACLGITPIDPIEFDLLFERFVDPSRPNAPDFDIDMDATRRGEIAEWLKKKYGGPDGDRVARIVALATFGLKAALRDTCFAHSVDSGVAFALGAAAEDVDTTLEKRLFECAVADRPAMFAEARQALEAGANPKAAAFIQARPDIVDAALAMAGRAVRIGRHAAGYVVAPGPMVDHLPVTKIRDPETNQNVVITAWGEGQASQDISPAGLMKLDLLPLDTLTVISDIVQAASRRHGRDVASEIDPLNMDWQDPAVLAEFASGNGFGLHQLNQSDQSLAQFARKLRPRSVHDMIAAVAMYRPGPMQFLEEFVARHHGFSQAEPVHEIYDAVVEETYGIAVYQEQVMKILHQLGGIALREAHNTIKAISKKKLDKIQKPKAEFISGCALHGIPAAEAERIFGLIEKFAGYGFNKAHAASYGVLGWITAYLRSRYPLEFWWAWLNRTDNQAAARGKTERKVALLMRQAAQVGIRLLPPAIGRSRGRWFITKSGALAAPLSLVMGVGEKAADLQWEGNRIKPWATIWDFLAWAEKNRKVLNRGAIGALAKAGAFTPLGVSPEAANDLVTTWGDFKASKAAGTQTQQLQAAVDMYPTEILATLEDGETRMAFEKAALGFCFWHNPWAQGGRQETVLRLLDEGRIVSEDERRVRGKRRAFQVAAIRKHKDKKGRTMAFITFQSVVGASVQGIVFGSDWANLGRLVRVDGVYLVAGEFDQKGTYIVGGCQRPFVDVDTLARPAQEGMDAVQAVRG